jgi:hypothetical protein
MDVPEVRRRVRAAIEQSRREATSRRERVDAAARAYEEFLSRVAVPLFHQLASALAAEGYRYKVFTPSDSVRLAAERSADDFVELVLDSTLDPPTVVGRSSRGRGRRLISIDRPLREGAAVGDLTEEDILEFVLGFLGDTQSA